MAVKEILRFLTELTANNDYAWMAEHKSWQKETRAQFESLLQELMVQLGEDDPAVIGLRADELIFRLNRDTRFSHDKSPYNPAYRAHIGPAGRAPIPVGYYLVISPQRSIIGGGLYAAMFSEATEQIRHYIAGHLTQWEAILQDEAFAASFTLQGEKLKRIPRGFEADSPAGEYLKYKSWYIEYPLAEADLANDGIFIQQALDKCRLMKPFNDFLNAALAGFQMPQRPGR